MLGVQISKAVGYADVYIHMSIMFLLGVQISKAVGYTDVCIHMSIMYLGIQISKAFGYTDVCTTGCETVRDSVLHKKGHFRKRDHSSDVHTVPILLGCNPWDVILNWK